MSKHMPDTYIKIRTAETNTETERNKEVQTERQEEILRHQIVVIMLFVNVYLLRGVDFTDSFLKRITGL